MWRFLDGARTAGELYGRALVVLWAAHYAREEVLPGAEQRTNLVGYDLEDRALKALEKLGRRHRPVALRRLEQAIAAHAADYRERKEGLEDDRARESHLADGFLAEELDERGSPRPDAYEARAQRRETATTIDGDADGQPSP